MEAFRARRFVWEAIELIAATRVLIFSTATLVAPMLSEISPIAMLTCSEEVFSFSSCCAESLLLPLILSAVVSRSAALVETCWIFSLILPVFSVACWISSACCVAPVAIS